MHIGETRDSRFDAELVIGPRGACHRARVRATRWRGPVRIAPE